MNNILLNAPIIIGIGAANVTLNTSISTIYAEVKKQPSDWLIEAYMPGIIEYTYQNSVSITTNIVHGLIARIDVFGDYQGKLMNQVGINDSIKSLINLNLDISFDDCYVLINHNSNGNGLIIMLNEDEDIEDLDSIEHCTIARFIVEDYALLNFPKI